MSMNIQTLRVRLKGQAIQHQLAMKGFSCLNNFVGIHSAMEGI